MKIVGVNGSLSKDSNTYKGINAILKVAESEGIDVAMFDLRNNPLPLYNPEQIDLLADENVRLLRKLLAEADGIILGSPEYHGSMSGAFKNAIDWMGSEQFKDKAVALVSASGGPTSMNTLNSMQVMVRNLHGWVIPILGSIPGKTTFTSDEQFAEEGMQSRFHKMATELANMAELLKRKNTLVSK
jgi:azobenzene reductase